MHYTELVPADQGRLPTHIDRSCRPKGWRVAITIKCPFCGTSADIEDALLGKKLRCADKGCRKAFRVTPDGETLPVIERADRAAKPAGAADWAASPPPPVRAAGPAEADWLSAPPPVSGGGGYAAPPRRGAAPTVPEEADYQGDLTPGYAASGGDDELEETYEAQDGHYYSHYPTKSKKGKLIGFALIGVLTIGIAVGAFVFFKKTESNKAESELTAESFVNQNQWAKAKEAFGKLAQQFPNPADAKRYEFFQKWIEIQQDRENGSLEKLKNAESNLSSFFQNYKGEEIFREKGFRSKVWATSIALADASAKEADRSADPSFLTMAEKMLQMAGDCIGGEKDQAEAEKKQAEVQKLVATAQEAIAADQAAKKVQAELDKTNQARQPQGVERVQAAYAKALQEHPRLAQNAELAAKIDALKADEPKWVTYRALNQEAQKPKDDADAASLLVSPPIKAAPETVQAEGVVLAVARGAVYGLSAKNGEPRWAIRVGVDEQNLPARLPARRGQKDIALVLSQNEAKQTVLNAIDVNSGKQEWRRTLSAPCPAGPLLVGFRAYVPTLDGKLSVVNVADGKLVGEFSTGARLTVPLGYDRRNNVLYAPADAKRIFVFDLAKNRCADVIYTNHAAGLLRGAPIIAGHSRSGGAAGGASGDLSTFVIAEGAGIGGLKVRVFPVQASGKDYKPVDEFTLPGQSWFTPYFDGDTLGLITDKGYLAVFGVNRDTADVKPLTPIVEGLIPGMAPVGADASNLQPKARAQVAFVGLGEWWALADNKLVHVRVDPFRKQLVAAPALTVELGSPLHEATLSPDGKLVIVVSLSPDRRILATALDRVTGGVVWQRQLGLVPTQDSVSLGEETLTIDKSGALYLVKASQIPDKLDVPWLSVGDWPAGAVKGMTYARLLTPPGGRSAVCLVYNGLTQQVLLRRYDPARGVAERTYSLPSAPLGSAAVSDDGTVIIPCRDGFLHEFHVDQPTPGARFTWRAGEGASLSAPGHALLLSDKELLATDGLRKIQRWERMDGKTWARVAAGDLTLGSRIVTPILGLKDPSGQPAICLGDDTGKLTVLAVGNLPSSREWEVKGNITRGPFRLGESRLGCVVDGSKLYWFDLNGPDGESLTHDVAAAGDPEAGIVGQPQAVGEFILIPELSGKFTWLKAKTGENAGSAIQLVGSLVPASGAVPLGKHWSFAPLSDGTVLLIPQPGAKP